MAESFNLILKEMLDGNQGKPEPIASVLGVSSTTVHRWLNGKSKPRPAQEAKLRDISKSRRGKISTTGDDLFSPNFIEQSVKASLLTLLQELREILHRVGKFSSRHEGLDEISKLLFAHFVNLRHVGQGINHSLLSNPSASLTAFVENAYKTHLPKNSRSGLKPEVFQLKLHDGDDLFASQIIEAFHQLTTPTVVSQIFGCNGIDILNDTFGHFLSDSFTEEKELGQYLTPSEVVRFICEAALSSLSENEVSMLLDPDRHSSFGYVIDPSCGVGSFLTEFLRQASHLLPNNATAKSSFIESAATKMLVGVDKSERMIRLATSNLALFGFPLSRLHLANGLAQDGSDGKLMSEFNGTARLILTNPPFGAAFPVKALSQYEATKWLTKSAKQSTIDSEILFLERYIEWLVPSGKLFAIVPESVLTNKGLYESLRRHLSGKATLQHVISLPQNTFASAGTSTKTSILTLQKRTKTKATESHVYFAICNSLGFEVVTRNSVRRKVRTGVSDLDAIAKDLTGKRGSIGSETSLMVPVSASRWDASFWINEKRFRKNGSSATDRVLRDVATIVTDRENPQRRGDASFPYIEISDINSELLLARAKIILCSNAPSRARRLVKADDILISTVRPDRRTIGIVPKELDNAICSTGFAVVRAKNIHPLLLAKLLKSDYVTSQLCANASGVAYSVFDESILPNIKLPLLANDNLLTSRAKKLASIIEELNKELAVFDATCQKNLGN